MNIYVYTLYIFILHIVTWKREHHMPSFLEGEEYGEFWPLTDKGNTRKNQVHGANHKFDFRSTQTVESKVPLRCLKRAVISNLLGTRIQRPKEMSEVTYVSLVIDILTTDQAKRNGRGKSTVVTLYRTESCLWASEGGPRSGRNTSLVLRADTKGRGSFRKKKWSVVPKQTSRCRKVRMGFLRIRSREATTRTTRAVQGPEARPRLVGKWMG